MSYNYLSPNFFDFNSFSNKNIFSSKNIIDLVAPDHKVHFINPMKITITAKPIEISALEKFHVEVKLPETHDIKLLLADPPWDWTKTWGSHLAPENRSCQCEIAILMRSGCQCGGV